jgi:hypothetical protein
MRFYLFCTALHALFLALIFTLCPLLLTAQTPDTLWTKTYGGTENDIGLSVQQTSDNGYVVTGWTCSSGAGGADIYLLKTDSLGDTLWTKTYGGGLDEQGLSVQQTFDNGFIIAGWTVTFGAGDLDIYLIRTDSLGDTLWTGTYGSVARDKACSVLQISDGGFVVAGCYTWFGSADVSLIRVAPNNCPVWWCNYGGDYHDYAYSMKATSDGGYIIAGETRSFGPGTPNKPNVYLLKTNVNGDTIWTKTYGTVENEVGYAVRQTADSGYIITGSGSDQSGNPSMLLIKTDPEGNSIWTKTYCGAGRANGYAVVETDDGGFLAVGETVDDIYMIKLNANGDSVWAKIFGGDYIDAAQAIEKTHDSGYIITGYTQSLSMNRNVWLAKIAPDTFGVEDNNIQDLATMEILIHPNPFYRNVCIEFDLFFGEDPTEFSIYDISGRLVKKLYYNSSPSNNHIRITWDGYDDTGKQLPAGVYFLHARQRDFSNIKKLILLR